MGNTLESETLATLLSACGVCHRWRELARGTQTTKQLEVRWAGAWIPADLLTLANVRELLGLERQAERVYAAVHFTRF